MKKQIEHRIFYQYSPETVWEYLTKPELIEQWLMKNNFQPVVGHDFEFRANPLPDYNWDGIIYCKVLEVVPQKNLTYSWKLGPGDGKITIDSIVTFTLTEKNNGTELHLVHSGFKEMSGFSIISLMDAGWLRNMKKIDELLNK